MSLYLTETNPVPKNTQPTNSFQVHSTNQANMRMSLRAVPPCNVSIQGGTFSAAAVVQTPTLSRNSITMEITELKEKKTRSLRKRWMEYQGVSNWDGLLDPLDDDLREEILRYGEFVEATYKSFDFDLSSPTYGNRRFPKDSLLRRCGLANSGYKITKNLRTTSGITLPEWFERVPSWVSTQSSWVGFVAVCQDKEEISRLGRRDIVIALRGTVTCLEWLENLRATLTRLPPISSSSPPMVESGFLSLYTSGSSTIPSLQNMVREEIGRLLKSYGGEPLSLTITGHSLGAALSTLVAYDIKATFRKTPLVTVISFGGPRVGDPVFRRQLDKQGVRVLRIVNSDDVITKVPGFTCDEDHDTTTGADDLSRHVPEWVKRWKARTQWVYAEVGRELRLCSRHSPYLKGIDFATCHDLKTYLHLVDGFVSSGCPFQARAIRTLLSRHLSKKIGV